MSDFCTPCGMPLDQCMCGTLQPSEGGNVSQPMNKGHIQAEPKVKAQVHTGDGRVFGDEIGPAEGANTEDPPSNLVYIDGKEHELEPRPVKYESEADFQNRVEATRHVSDAAFARRVAESGIYAIRGLVEACGKHGSPQLMKELREAVDRYEADVRKKLERS